MPVLLASTCWTILSDRKMWLYHSESATTQLIVLLANGRPFKTHLMIVCKSVFFPLFKSLFPAVMWITWAQEKLPRDYQESMMLNLIHVLMTNWWKTHQLKNRLNQLLEILYPRQQRETMQCNAMVENVHYKQAIRMHFVTYGPKVGQAVDWDSSIAV